MFFNMRILSYYILALTLLCLGCFKNYNHEFKGTNISINNNIDSDSVIVNYYLPYKKNLEESLMNKPIAYSKKTYRKNDGELNSTLGNLFADATYEMTNERFKKISNENIDIVLLNNGGIRSIISKGDISEKTAFELMPFENSIVVVKLSGTSINKMIKYLIKAKLPHPIKGLKIVLNKDYTLSSVLINNSNIVDDKVYNVATTDYLLDGGDKMYFLDEKIQIIDINYKMRDVLIDYFKKTDTLRLKIDNRFIRK